MAIGTACAVLLGGCSGISQLMPAQQEAQPESLPAESSVVEEVIDPEEQARLDLLDALESVSIPTTTETSRRSDSGVAAPYESGAEEEDESTDSEESDVLIPGEVDLFGQQHHGSGYPLDEQLLRTGRVHRALGDFLILRGQLLHHGLRIGVHEDVRCRIPTQCRSPPEQDSGFPAWLPARSAQTGCSPAARPACTAAGLR